MSKGKETVASSFRPTTGSPLRALTLTISPVAVFNFGNAPRRYSKDDVYRVSSLFLWKGLSVCLFLFFPFRRFAPRFLRWRVTGSGLQKRASAPRTLRGRGERPRAALTNSGGDGSRGNGGRLLKTEGKGGKRRENGGEVKHSEAKASGGG